MIFTGGNDNEIINMSKTNCFLFIGLISLIVGLSLALLGTMSDITAQWGVQRSNLAALNVAVAVSIILITLTIGILKLKWGVFILFGTYPILNSVSGRSYLIIDPFVINPFSAGLWLLTLLSARRWLKLTIYKFDILWFCAIISASISSIYVTHDANNTVRDIIFQLVEPFIAYILLRSAIVKDISQKSAVYWFGQIAITMLLIHFGLLVVDLLRGGGLIKLFTARSTYGRLWSGGLNEPSQAAMLLSTLLFPVIIITMKSSLFYGRWIPLLMITIIIASTTRRTIILVGISFLIFIYFIKKNNLSEIIWPQLRIFCIVAIILLIVTIPNYIGRFTGSDIQRTYKSSDHTILKGYELEHNALVYLRRLIVSIDIIRDHPWFGIGLGDRSIYWQYMLKRGENFHEAGIGNVIENISGILLMGIPVFLIFLARSLLILRLLFSRFKDVDADERLLAIGLAIPMLMAIIFWNWVPHLIGVSFYAIQGYFVNRNTHLIWGSFILAWTVSYLETNHINKH